ncbi:MAG TPA: T9SS type A sorting domain-containing protein, partial [Cytophagaceae bacterium]
KKSFTSPNPAPQNGGKLNVENTLNETYTFYIINSSGNVEFENDFAGEQTDMPQLKPGFYYYKIVNANGDLVSKGKFFIQGS